MTPAAAKTRGKDALYRAGVPTAPDVQILLDAHGVPAEGTLILYSDVEGQLGLARRTHRFRTVTAEWRRRLEEEHRCLLVTEPTVGWTAADPKARVGVCGKLVGNLVRTSRKCADIAARTDRRRLDADGRRRLDHVREADAHMRLFVLTGPKALPSGD